MLMGSENNSDKNNLPAVTDSGKGRKDAIDLEAEKKEISKRYRHLLRACKSNLDKKDKKQEEKLIKQVEEEMLEAARNLDFEKAMELRDILFEIKSSRK